MFSWVCTRLNYDATFSHDVSRCPCEHGGSAKASRSVEGEVGRNDDSGMAKSVCEIQGLRVEVIQSLRL